MTQRDLVDSHFTETVWELPKGHGAAAPADGAGPAQPSPGTVRDRDAPLRPGSSLTGQRCLELFDAQLASRHLDLAARWLRAEAAGFYTIGSAGPSQLGGRPRSGFPGHGRTTRSWCAASATPRSTIPPRPER